MGNRTGTGSTYYVVQQRLYVSVVVRTTYSCNRKPTGTGTGTGAYRAGVHRAGPVPVPASCTIRSQLYDRTAALPVVPATTRWLLQLQLKRACSCRTGICRGWPTTLCCSTATHVGIGGRAQRYCRQPAGVSAPPPAHSTCKRRKSSASITWRGWRRCEGDGGGEGEGELARVGGPLGMRDG